MPENPALADLIGEELKLIRESVPGVRGSVAATSDGILIAHDVHDLEPTQIAALVAAMHAVAVRATLSTESGQLKDVITRASEGYLAVLRGRQRRHRGGPRNDRAERRHPELPGPRDHRAGGQTSRPDIARRPRRGPSHPGHSVGQGAAGWPTGPLRSAVRPSAPLSRAGQTASGASVAREHLPQGSAEGAAWCGGPAAGPRSAAGRAPRRAAGGRRSGRGPARTGRRG